MKTRTLLLLLGGFAATATACTSTRTVEVVTKPAPPSAPAPAPAVVVASARPSHYRLVSVDDRRAEAIFEAVTIASPALSDADDVAIQRQSGFEPLVVPIDRLSQYLDGNGVERTVEIEEGTLFDAFYSGDGTLERLAPHGE